MTMNTTINTTSTDPETAVREAQEALEALDETEIMVYEEGGLDRALESARELVSSLELVETTRRALRLHFASGGAGTYLLRDCSGDCELEDVTEEEVIEQYADMGDWCDRSETQWDTCYTRPKHLPDEEWTRHRVEIPPIEPRCSESVHDWQSPHSIVGGCKENPGVWGNGGGVVINEVCMLCGCQRRTDTWAQDRATGEQGLVSVSYTPGYYELAELESD